jgi:hypothetical protein
MLAIGAQLALKREALFQARGPRLMIFPEDALKSSPSWQTRGFFLSQRLGPFYACTTIFFKL